MVRRDNTIAALMDEFVCLRIIQMNGVDLSLFQFDYDMSFAVFFMNADETVYGRYGTRSDRPDDADKHISIEGLKESMEAALSLNRCYPEVAPELEEKRGGEPRYARAELYPELKNYTPKINYQNETAKSCIHCHQVHNSQRQGLRDARLSIPDEMLYLYPMPAVMGLEIDSKTRATVSKVIPGSSAAMAGLKAGDELINVKGQPLISQADLQWILQQQGSAGGTLPMKVSRGGETLYTAVELQEGWRKKTDFGWRVSTWDLRRMALGGMSLIPDDSGRAEGVALEVKNAGKYGGHAVARKAGVRPGDKIISIGGKSDKATEAEVIAYLLETTEKGGMISLSVKRNGREMTIPFRAQ